VAKRARVAVEDDEVLQEAPPIKVAEPLITAYRPQMWGELIGHEEAIPKLRRTIQSNSHAHAYLLVGPSGVGKTTIARLIAQEFEAEVLEVDAATYSGKDEMKQLIETGRHMSLSGAGKRLILMNEVQRLSKAAWDALLTTLEEPPPHLYFALTTTEPDKVPDAVNTRSYRVLLRSVGHKDIETLLEAVIAAEGWEVVDDVFNAIVNASNGQPRLALSILQSAYDAESSDEVTRIAGLIDQDNSPLIELCQFLIAGKTNWELIQRMLQRVNDDDYQPGLTICGRYIAAVAIKSENASTAQRALSLIEAFAAPAATFDPKVQFLAAISRYVWSMK
jgi:DNA polymerase III gamma/tau subunit